MTARITYEMQELPHPYDEKQRKQGVKAMCLVRVTRSASGTWIEQEPVALFNYDSEARLFQEHVMAEGLDKKLVVVEQSYRELYESTQRSLSSRKGGMNNIKDSGRAVIDGDCIVIRVAIEALETIIDGVVSLYDEDGEPRFKVTDAPKFAEDLVRSLNDEDEQGTTRIHLMFDNAIDHAVEYGAEGVEERES